jgi:HAD superfamily hydrolase (TIGR01549 family)
LCAPATAAWNPVVRVSAWQGSPGQLGRVDDGAAAVPRFWVVADAVAGHQSAPTAASVPRAARVPAVLREAGTLARSVLSNVARAGWERFDGIVGPASVRILAARGKVGRDRAATTDAATAEPQARIAAMAKAALLDIDGTLVDTNYQHALGWYRSFREHGFIFPIWKLHRHIGMGGDQLVKAIAGAAVEAEHGDSLRALEKERYHELIGEVELMADARRLIVELSDRGHAVVLASSASAEDLAHYRGMLDVDESITAATSSDDVEATKPAPDLILAAIDKVQGGSDPVMVGDSTWDCESSKRAGIPSIALLTGGFGADELRAAGAVAVFESLASLLERIDETPLR